jgi:hypothetical protein
MYPYRRSDPPGFGALRHWVDRPEADYHNLMWVATSQRLTKETFQRYRKQGGLVIPFNNTEDRIDLILRDPLPMIAGDGFGYGGLTIRCP